MLLLEYEPMYVIWYSSQMKSAKKLRPARYVAQTCSTVTAFMA